MADLRVAGLALAVLLTGCAADRPDAFGDDRPLGAPRSVSFEESFGIPIVQVEINGQGPFALVFDTGADMLMLDESVAKRLALPPSRYEGTSFARSIGGRSGVSYRRVDRLRSGTLEIGRLDAAILDLGDETGTGLDVDGLLGLGAFYPWVTTIDYQRKTITFSDGPRLAADAPGVLPLAQQYGLTAFIDGEYQGRRCTVRLDTGSSVALFAEDRFVSRAGLVNFVPLGSLTTPTGATGRKVGRIPGDLVLDAYRFPRPIVTAAYARPVFISSGRDWASLLDAELTVGAPFLRQFRIVLDQKSGRVALLRTDGSGPIESPPVRTVWLDAPLRADGDALLVLEAPPPGVVSARPSFDDPLPDAPTLQPGDRILGLDGVAPGALPHDAFVDHPEGATVRVSVQRGDETFEYATPVVTLVP